MKDWLGFLLVSLLQVSHWAGPEVVLGNKWLKESWASLKIRVEVRCVFQMWVLPLCMCVLVCMCMCVHVNKCTCSRVWRAMCTCVRMYVNVYVCAHVSPCANRFKTSFMGVFCSPGPGVEASGELRANVCVLEEEVTKGIKGDCSIVSLILITVGPSPTCDLAPPHPQGWNPHSLPW